jgi:hypothetical protein
MLVVDTNIIAALYIRGAYTDGVHQLRRRDDLWRTDPFAIIEFSNVLATYRRARYLTTTEAQRCLAQADRFLRPHYVEVPHDAALFPCPGRASGAPPCHGRQQTARRCTGAHAIAGRNSCSSLNRGIIAVRNRESEEIFC